MLTAAEFLQLIWVIVRKYLPYIIGAVALIGVVIWIDHRGYQRGFHKRDAEVAALTTTIANMKAASAQAEAKNLADVRQKEQAYATVSKDLEDALLSRDAAARSATADYIRLHPATKAPAGSASAGSVSNDNTAAGTTDEATGYTVVASSDLQICTDAFVTAQGLQDYVRGILAVK